MNSGERGFGARSHTKQAMYYTYLTDYAYLSSAAVLLATLKLAMVDFRHGKIPIDPAFI